MMMTSRPLHRAGLLAASWIALMASGCGGSPEGNLPPERAATAEDTNKLVKEIEAGRNSQYKGSRAPGMPR